MGKVTIQFITSYSDLYGANRSLFTLLLYLKAKGYKINVLLPRDGQMCVALKNAGIEYDVLPYYSGFLYIKPVFKHVLVPFLALLNMIMIPFIVRLIKRNNVDLIYSNSSLENLGIIVSKFLAVKHISHIREFMSLDYNSFFLFGNRVKQMFIEQSNGVIYVSQSVKNHITRNYVSKCPSTVIYNGISIPKGIMEKKVCVSKEITFGLVGIFDEAKGQHLAIDFFYRIKEQFPNSKLCIIGDKECGYKRKLIKMVKELAIEDRVKFVGFVKEPKDIYNSLDVLFMFSRSEGFGRVTIEAMSYGVPVLGYNSAGTAELVVHKRNGYLFKEFQEFRLGLMYVLNEANYTRLSKNAYDYVSKTFDESTYVTKVECFINKIIESTTI